MPFQHSPEELFLVSKVAVDQCLVRWRGGGNAVNSTARDAVGRKLFRRGQEDAFARLLPFVNSTFFMPSKSL
jgi:hypothetical protein